jgi:hypothetical protein
MKKILLLIAFVATGLFANAQDAASKPAAKKATSADATARATKNTEKMTTVLKLTEVQRPQVLKINLEKATAMDANKAKNSKDQKASETEKQRIITKWETDLKGVLTPDQIVTMKKVQADQAAKEKK